jgi:hypothetical protein
MGRFRSGKRWYRGSLRLLSPARPADTKTRTRMRLSPPDPLLAINGHLNSFRKLCQLRKGKG